MAIRLTREGFHVALRQSCWSHFDAAVHGDHASWKTLLAASPVRVQWDPERTMDGSPLPHRSLQVGLSGAPVTSYVNNWIVSIADITADLPGIRSKDHPVPVERPYLLPPDIEHRVGVTAHELE